MRIKFIPVVLLLFALAGCKPNMAYKYNQKVNRLEKDLGPSIDEALRKFNVFYKDKNYDSVVIVSQSMEDLIKEKMKEIQKINMSNVEGGDEFKNAAIKYFSQIKNVFTAYKRFGMQTNEELREVERLRMSEITNEYDSGIEVMREAQRKFAAANNFKIK